MNLLRDETGPRGCDNCGELTHLEQACPQPHRPVDQRRNPSRKCVVCERMTYTQNNRYCSLDCADTDGVCEK